MNQNSRKTFGNWGEYRASDYLEEQGWIIIERNYRTKFGELDIIASKDEVLVFFEVKTRRTKSFGDPEVSVGLRKQKHLVDSALTYLQTLEPEYTGAWRIDVLAIRSGENQKDPEIVWFENAVNDYE